MCCTHTTHTDNYTTTFRYFMLCTAQYEDMYYKCVEVTPTYIQKFIVVSLFYAMLCIAKKNILVADGKLAATYIVGTRRIHTNMQWLYL